MRRRRAALVKVSAPQTVARAVPPPLVHAPEEHSPAPLPQASPQAPSPSPDHRSSILLFGQFEVYDKEGNELTKLFTPLLKELFLLIAIHTLRSGKGISSEKLYATLWRDKSNKDAQNNRSVNMVKLKGILDKLGTCAIGKEADKWLLHYAQDQIRMDLAEFLALVQVPTPGHEEIRQLLAIVHRGAFLADTVYPWLDDIQSEVSDKALDLLSGASLRFEGEPEFLLEIAGGIFLFDPVNEEALRVKCKSLSVLGRHSLAKAAFEKFAKEYLQMYGEEFQHSFHEILSN
jgi:two-component SAPR family response regulator